jgi:DNA-directed RNA polymerase subunit M/transcription elongation factor TFIIS
MALARPAAANGARSSGRRNAAKRTAKQKEIGKTMAKIAKTGDRKKEMDTTKSTDCPKCSKPTRIVKRVKDRERGVPGGVYISCSACEFHEKL